jgi:hypothetical protein
VQAVGRGETKIDKNRAVVGAEEDVRRLDVLVSDAVDVQMVDGGKELAEVGFRSRLG